MESGLERAVAHIKEKGLPSVEQMRNDIAQWEAEDLRASLEAKFVEYNGLFGRFKSGEELTKGEMLRMTDLSTEFQKLMGE
ncbi:MAG: hypothetical protein A2762_00045 [Candidatus Lloydbacteria bacterium RIFCSPHIGHO2_01_FULL_54_11]|nr:MAG: hypothetical protein A2762_00045 [Candidatus Lloydbacteria bacterium RIFCSPHIGHO2_01_FULL_54_11]OGZ13199.1 MAG: hypothetical protein A2948_06000 [Candidatus Lloydbacteria bacterium RIFCSPLOWO2_01_FULL_54_18]OGZ17046.1 MAG: hypothetical protein A3H76_01020 [Candidatus Lloydbacteria bacterium RIFCSPLOWO2_02_FULL_54_12]